MSNRTPDNNPSVSIVVPLFNEASTVQSLQDQMRPLLTTCEVIFVDGGSTDCTLELIDPEFRVLKSEKGRARQMNAGAQASTGEILLFLHSDSVLPADVLGEVRQVMRNKRCGCFGVKFPSRNLFMLTCRVGSNARVRFGHIMFGDQGIFIERKLFFEIGMFPEIALMEDYQLSLTLRNLGIHPGMTAHRIETSDRRFPSKTLSKLRVMYQMRMLRRQYRQGVCPDDLARRYADIR